MPKKLRYIQSLLELWCLLLICLILGRRILDLSPQYIRRSSALYLAPGLGLAGLLWLASLYGRFMPFHWGPSFSLVLVLTTVSLFVEPRKQELWQHSKWLCLVAWIASLPVFGPELRYGGYSPFTDIFTYLAQSQWLQFHSFSEKITDLASHPALTQIALYQTTGARMGGTFFLGFVQSLFHLTWSYDAYLPTVALGVVSGCLFLGGVVRQVIPLKRPVILSLSLLPALLSNGFIYGAEWGFFPQTYGLAFALGLCATLPGLVQQVLRIQLSWQQSLLWAFPSALCAAAMLLAYNEPFPLFFAAIGLFMLLVMSLHATRFKALASISLILFIELMLLMNTELVRLIHNIYQTLTISHDGGAIGWPVLWSPLRFFVFSFGMASYFRQILFSLDGFISFILAPIMLGLLFYVLVSFMHQKPKRRLMLGLLFCFELVLWCFFIKFRYFSVSNVPEAIGQTFLQFKIAKYVSPFSLSLLAIGGGIWWFYGKTARRYLQGLYVLVIVTGLCYHLIVVPKCFTTSFLHSVKQPRAPFDVLLKLRETVKNIPKDEIIYLGLEPNQMKLQQFLTYILWDRAVSGNFQDDVYLANQSQPIGSASWILLMANMGNSSGDNLPSPPFVLQKKPFLFVTLDGQQGGYDTETNAKGDVFNWVERAIDIHLTVQGDAKAIAFTCKFRTKDELPRTLRVQFKTSAGKILATYVLPHFQNDYILNSLWLPTDLSKQFVLHVETDDEPVLLGRFDPRKAAFMLSNLSLRLSPLSPEQAPLIQTEKSI